MACDDDPWLDEVLACVEVNLHCAFETWSEGSGSTAPSEASHGYLRKAFNASALAFDAHLRQCWRLSMMATLVRALRLLEQPMVQTRVARAVLAWVKASKSFDYADVDALEDRIEEFRQKLSSSIDDAVNMGTPSGDAGITEQHVAQARRDVVSVARRLERALPSPLVLKELVDEIWGNSDKHSGVAPSADVPASSSAPPLVPVKGVAVALAPSVFELATCAGASVRGTAPVPPAVPRQRTLRDGPYTRVEQAPVYRGASSFASAAPGQVAHAPGAPAPTVAPAPAARSVPSEPNRTVRSSARPASAVSDDLFMGEADVKRRYDNWTEEDQRKLVAGIKKYGTRWETIRESCGLAHKYGTQLREKWKNLCKTDASLRLAR
eukprot:TRINITY_DN1301_c0_g1_i2.p1 TRINITY_DN1301_c0_g1~~TRINITY_DN1301_c0_g1_i2.p1  ORF type:complete len:380 (+),score=72.89 TRINITY_DN1301_c0_g1_i2:882-2021(+)